MESYHSNGEQAQAPATPIEIIRDNLNQYDSNESLRDDLFRIDSLYGGTKFGNSLREHASTAGMAIIYREGLTPNTPSHKNEVYYYGELLGLSASMKAMQNNAESQAVLNSEFTTIPLRLMDESSEAHRCRTAMDNLEQLDYMDEIFDNLPMDDQLTLMAAAYRACDGFGRPNEEKSFLRGILYAQTRIETGIGRRLQPKVVN
jgi:hypothetical protein